MSSCDVKKSWYGVAFSISGVGVSGRSSMTNVAIPLYESDGELMFSSGLGECEAEGRLLNPAVTEVSRKVGLLV